MLSDVLEYINSCVSGPGLAAVIFVCGVVLFARLGPFAIVHPRRTLAALRSGGVDGMSPAKAMCVALAGTLGVGNIAGVASAIYIGGAGAIFWMWVSALAAMPIKYAETVLALGHRRLKEDGWHGGAFFYITDTRRKWSGFSAGLFAALCLATSLSMGSAVQAEAAASALTRLTGLPTVVCGVIVALPVLAVILGGLKRIADISAKLIPAVCGLYILMSLYIIFGNIPLLGMVFGKIFAGAADISAAGGGIFGFTLSRVVSVGVTRGIVSNEAGCGTAPIAHSGAEVKSPAVQGVFGMLEVAVDTLVICTMTALVVLIGAEKGLSVGVDGMETALGAFGMFIPFSDRALSVSVIIFAFCTMICWYYYGSESIAYLGLRHAGKVYPFIFAAAAVTGTLSGEAVWQFTDLFVSLMTILNMGCVMMYTREIKTGTDAYFGRRGLR